MIFLYYSVSTTNNQDFQITLKTEYPSLRMQYSFDNGRTWNAYSYPFSVRDINQNLLLRTL